MSGKVHKLARPPTAKADGFNRLFHEIVDTEAWKYISQSGALPLLIYIWRRYNGHNNGRVSYSLREAVSQLGCGKTRAVRWFRDLQEAGFIVPVQRGSFSYKNAARAARATTWRLTMEPCDGKAPTRDYRRFAPVGGSNA
jgi:hypothetical protein